MGSRNSFLLLCSAFFLLNTLSAQSVISAQLQGTQKRIPIEVSAGKNRIQLCGLKKGNTYNVVAVAAVPEQQLNFNLTMRSGALETAAKKQSMAGRPQYRRFTAPAECVELTLEVQSKQTSGQMPIYLSVVCADCQQDNAFLDKFLSKVESSANLSTSGGTSANSLITNTLIGGNCFDISNITSSGAANSRGTFTNGITNIGLANGVVMSTGNVNALPGPNTAGNTSGNTAGFNVNSADDPDLATLTGGNQWDVTKIEFELHAHLLDGSI